jgi:outer membrane immunogenic protein
LVVLSLPGLAAAQTAQDQPFSWTGFYGGLNAGMEFFSANGTRSCSAPSGLFGALCTPATGLQAQSTGFAGGAQAGYLYQIDRVVMGVEVDFSGLSAQTATTTYSTAPGLLPVPTIQTIKQQVDWLATLRGRLGYDFGRTLVYGTAGLALGGTRIEGNFTFPSLFGESFPASGQATMPGFVVGGGIEYAVFDHWTVRAEGLYFDLGVQNVYNSGGQPVNVPITEGYGGRFTGAIARLAVNYKF